MPIINGMLILDYPDRLTDKVLMDEQKKLIDEQSAWMIDFIKKNDIKIVGVNGKIMIQDNDHN
jgi:hypothetical protein